MNHFTRRTECPTSGDKFYTNQRGGGYANCINGWPSAWPSSVLSNCVGYSTSRFNEIYSELSGLVGMKYPNLNCNAEDFIDRARSAYPDLVINNQPEPGAIMVWNGAGDLAGHVAIVEDVVSESKVYTSESDYGGTKFSRRTRDNSNGRWGLGSSYTFLGFIHNPAVNESSIEPTTRNEWVDQAEVLESGILRIRNKPTLSGDFIGYIKKGIYNVLGQSDADGYTWYKVSEGCYIANVDTCVSFLPKKEWVEPIPSSRDQSMNQISISDIKLRIRCNPSLEATKMGICVSNSYYNVSAIDNADGLFWYKIGESAWCAGVDGVEYLAATSIETRVSELETMVEDLSAIIKTLVDEVSSLKDSTVYKEGE